MSTAYEAQTSDFKISVSNFAGSTRVSGACSGSKNVSLGSYLIVGKEKSEKSHFANFLEFFENFDEVAFLDFIRIEWAELAVSSYNEKSSQIFILKSKFRNQNLYFHAKRSDIGPIGAWLHRSL